MAERENRTEFVGVLLDPTLNWFKHVTGPEKQLSVVISALKRLSRELSADGLCHSMMIYALLVWGNCPNSDIMFKY